LGEIQTFSGVTQISGLAYDVVSAVSTVEFQLNSTAGSWTTCDALDGLFDESTEDFSCDLGTIVTGSRGSLVRVRTHQGGTDFHYVSSVR